LPLLEARFVEGLLPPETDDAALQWRIEEWERCEADPAYFIRAHVQVKDDTAGEWIPFDLWPAQEETLRLLQENPLVVILKARQLGFTWLLLSYALWLMLFKPSVTVLLLSKRDEEAIELLDVRLKGMWDLMPEWMRGRVGPAETDAKHQWLLGNGSRALAFPTTGARSYTAKLVIVDEADHLAEAGTRNVLGKLLNTVKPTIDAGGQLALLSTPDKDRPVSLFKRIYLAAKSGLNSYAHVFYGWRARPTRTDEWYEQQKRDTLANTGSLDDLYQEYPETDAEALSPRSLDKRIPGQWLLQCYREREPLTPDQLPAGTPTVPGLVVYGAPVRGVEYRVGADPAEGNPTSDFSSCLVVSRLTGEEVAHFSGRFEPAVFASYMADLHNWYNEAPMLPERNNHGHAVISWLDDHGYGSSILSGTDGRPGWLTTTASKARMYSEVADGLRQGDALIHSQDVYLQLASIDGGKLRAPEEQHDDEAVAWGLATLARGMEDPGGGISEEVGEALEAWSGI